MSMPPAAGAAGDTRLIDAVKSANGPAIRLLLRDHVDVNAAEADGTTALHWAVRASDLGTVKQLLDAQADVNASNRYAVTPLSVAATNGNEEMIATLVAAGLVLANAWSLVRPHVRGPRVGWTLASVALAAALSLAGATPVRVLLALAIWGALTPPRRTP